MHKFVLLAVLIIAGCGGSNGYVVTRDGRLVAETPEVAAEEFAAQLARRAVDGAGAGWKATATIRELPVLHQVRADEYGWATMTVAVVLVPPPGVTADAEIQRRAEASVRASARWRVARDQDVQVAWDMQATGALLPGSQRYTTIIGDTWTGISTAFYGTTQHWRVIADANPGIDASPLPVGTALIIPPKP